VLEKRDFGEVSNGRCLRCPKKRLEDWTISMKDKVVIVLTGSGLTTLQPHEVQRSEKSEGPYKSMCMKQLANPAIFVRRSSRAICCESKGNRFLQKFKSFFEENKG